MDAKFGMIRSTSDKDTSPHKIQALRGTANVYLHNSPHTTTQCPKLLFTRYLVRFHLSRLFEMTENITIYRKCLNSLSALPQANTPLYRPQKHLRRCNTQLPQFPRLRPISHSLRYEASSRLYSLRHLRSLFLLGLHSWF